MDSYLYKYKKYKNKYNKLKTLYGGFFKCDVNTFVVNSSYLEVNNIFYLTNITNGQCSIINIFDYKIINYISSMKNIYSENSN